MCRIFRAPFRRSVHWSSNWPVASRFALHRFFFLYSIPGDYLVYYYSTFFLFSFNWFLQLKSLFVLASRKQNELDRKRTIYVFTITSILSVSLFVLLAPINWINYFPFNGTLDSWFNRNTFVLFAVALVASEYWFPFDYIFFRFNVSRVITVSVAWNSILSWKRKGASHTFMNK